MNAFHDSAMPTLPPIHNCPDCDEPLMFGFSETSGLSGWKRGDSVNQSPDTNHYLCFPCRKAWKQRLDGPLTQDVVGDLSYFCCKRPECGARLDVTQDSMTPTEIQLRCEQGHQFAIELTEEGGLQLAALVP